MGEHQDVNDLGKHIQWDNMSYVHEPDEDAEAAPDDVVYVCLPGEFWIHDYSEVFHGCGERKCLTHELNLRWVSDQSQLTTVTTQEKLCLAGVHHHTVLGKPGAQHVQHVLHSQLQLR